VNHSKLNHTELEGIHLLRERIKSAKIPSSSLDQSLNLCTWNIRHWGQKRRKRFSLHCIAEIFNPFDLIAVTELRRNISELKYVLDLLGPFWKVVFSDYTTDAGGNKERIAFVYDARSVKFTGLAAESDGPRKKNKTTGQYVPNFNWWRKPYLASFRAGHFDFVLLAVHLQWGTVGGREKELSQLAEWIKTFQKDEFRIDRDIIALGDFNIPNYRSKLYKAVTQFGLRAPNSILSLEHGSNLKKDKRYDQILHHPSITGSVFSKHGGVVDFYKKNHKAFKPYADLTKTKFTYELSDHLPLWVQLNLDVADEQLDQLIAVRT
jgi:endonuclease/exonuclease/phosphatase family metal-dependent hydrolase